MSRVSEGLIEISEVMSVIMRKNPQLSKSDIVSKTKEKLPSYSKNWISGVYDDIMNGFYN